MNELDNFRQKYPQYNDMDDTTLANKLASKYPEYADLPSKIQPKSFGQRAGESMTEMGKSLIPSISGDISGKSITPTDIMTGLMPYKAGQIINENIAKTAVPMYEKNPILNKIPFGPRIAGDPNVMIGLMTGGEEIPAMGKMLIPSTEQATKLSGKLLKRFMKLSPKDYEYGFNPPEGVAKENIIAKNIEDLQTQVKTRLTDVVNARNKLLKSGAENKSVTVNRNVFDPLFERLNILRKDPIPHTAEISRVEDMVRSLMADPNRENRILEMGKIKIKDAYDIMDRVDNLVNSWKEGGGTEIDSALRQVRHNMNEKIGTAVPNLKEYNYRIGNLIRASKGIDKTIDMSKPFLDRGVISTLGLPLEPLKSTGFRTGVASKLGEKYPSLIPTAE